MTHGEHTSRRRRRHSAAHSRPRHPQTDRSHRSDAPNTDTEPQRGLTGDGGPTRGLAITANVQPAVKDEDGRLPRVPPGGALLLYVWRCCLETTVSVSRPPRHRKCAVLVLVLSEHDTADNIEPHQGVLASDSIPDVQAFSDQRPT